MQINYSSDNKSDSDSKTKEFLATAKERFDSCRDSMADIVDDFNDDIKFLSGKQWSDEMLRERRADRRPAIIVNKLEKAHGQVVNDFKQNRPSIKARPIDNNTDPDTADVINGLLRRIQSSGQYKEALDCAFYYAVAGGIGFLRVTTDYTSDDSFDQDIYVTKIDDPCNVFFPIDLCSHSDYSDAPYCFVRSIMTKKQLSETYPDIYDETDNSDDTVDVLEYFCVDTTPAWLILLSDGTTHTVKSKPQEGDIVPNTELIVDKVRKTIIREVKRSVITESEILEPETEWPGKYLPIVPITGQEIIVEGEKKYISLIRSAKDPQSMLNFWSSAFTEQIALAPKAPFLATPGQLEGFEREWSQANTKSFSVLHYNPKDVNGTLVPMPSRVSPPEVGSAIITGIQFASDNIKSSTGIYDASLGAGGNETSGRAINARQRQGSTANYHFSDNATRCLHQVGKIIVDLIPIIYDTPDRVIRIIGDDESDKVIVLNRSNPDKEGHLFDVSVGEYDITIDISPSYETKRIETSETLQALAQSNPIYHQISPDLMVATLDFPGRDELQARLKKYLSMTQPGLVEPDKTEESDPKQQMQMLMQQMQQLAQQSEQMQQQIQQDQQVIQQMDQVIQKQASEIEDKEREANLKITLKDMDSKVKLQIKEMDAELQLMKAEADKYKEEIKLYHDAQKHSSNMAIKICDHDKSVDHKCECKSDSGQYSSDNKNVEE